MIRRFLLALAAVAIMVPAAQAQSQPRKLADGVWAMTTKGGANAGWFTFGNSVVAVDAGRDAADAETLLHAIADTTGNKKVSLVIFTNNFGPHAGGVDIFSHAGATIVAQEKFASYFLSFLESRMPDAKTAKEHPPIVMTVAERMLLTDGHRQVEIDATGPADSAGDLIVYLAHEKVLFSGDLAETGILPPLFSKEIEPQGWIHTLGILSRLDIKQLVPGYGPIGPTDGVKGTLSYLEVADGLAKKMIQEKTPDSFIPTRLGEPDLAVKGLPPELEKSHEANVQALVKTLREREAAAKKGNAEKKEGAGHASH